MQLQEVMLSRAGQAAGRFVRRTVGGDAPLGVHAHDVVAVDRLRCHARLQLRHLLRGSALRLSGLPSKGRVG